MLKNLLLKVFLCCKNYQDKHFRHIRVTERTIIEEGIRGNIDFMLFFTMEGDKGRPSGNHTHIETNQLLCWKEAPLKQYCLIFSKSRVHATEKSSMIILEIDFNNGFLA
jgi:hypothetical protein